MQGAGRSATIVSWGDRASAFGTANSATFAANAPSFVARGIGFRVQKTERKTSKESPNELVHIKP
jgi:hypothetical protein